MNQNSLNWGIGITVIWLTVIISLWIFGGLSSPTSLNELGDFLAGIFAPIAFLWLILGYAQQGKQLEQNTKALEQQERALQLQIDEMKEGVKQQTRLVEMQNQQLIMLVQEKIPFIKLYDAKLNLNKNRFSTLENQLHTKSRKELSFKLKNEGDSVAKFIEIILDFDVVGSNFYKIDPQEINTVNFILTDPQINRILKFKDKYLTLKINFIDIYNNKYTAFYDLAYESGNENTVILQVLTHQNSSNSKVAN